MTTAPVIPVEQTAPAASAKPRPKRRWHRAAVPFTVLLALVVTTFVTHSLNEPDLADPAFLSPAHDAPVGSSVLAQRLEERGIRVQRETRTSDALLSAYQGNATLLVPAPALMHPDYLAMLASMPFTTRVVLVEPGNGELSRAGAPIEEAGVRWATAVEPAGVGCAVEGLSGGGDAAVRRTAYAIEPSAQQEQSCFAGGVLRVRFEDGDFVVVGSADPFRNDRIDEHGNSGFALGLLGTRPRLVWLDVHTQEPGPLVDPNAIPGEAVPPSMAPGGGTGGEQGTGTGDGQGEGQGDGQGSGSGSGSGSGTGDGEGQGSGDRGDDESEAGAQGPSFFDALPPAFWATLLGALLLALLMALWRARRLGPPVTEPLPFTVKGAETVLGRARLYQRAGAMLSGAQTLRRAAGPQIAQAVGLPPTAPAETIAAAVAVRHGGDPADYLAVLADDLPKKDADLVALAARLDALLAMVSTPPPRGETRG